MEEGEQPNVTRSFKVSGMPLSSYLKWKKSAIEDFGDCHWLKCISDHMSAKQIVELNQLWKKIEELELQLNQLVGQEPKEEVKEIKTFGGNENDKD